MLLHISVNFGNVDIFPEWAGYLLILGAISVFSKEEESSALLKPLCSILGVWAAAKWLLKIFDVSFDYYIITVIFAVVSLYFHFQLLTNLSQISEKHGCFQTKKILTLRTVNTVMTTVLTLPLPWGKYEILTLVVLLVHVIICIWICVVLFSFAKELNETKIT